MDISTHKTCTKCGETKPLEAFSPCGGKKYPHLRRGECKPCHAAHEVTQRSQFPDKYREFDRKRYQRDQPKRQAASRTYHKRTYPLRRVEIRARLRPKERAKYAEDPEKCRQKNRLYQKTHLERWILSQARRRARKKGLPDTFTQAERQFMYQYFGFACAVCSNQQGFTWGLADDHWVSLASPDCPGTIKTNMIPLCDGEGGCNNSKKDSDPHKWLVRRFGAKKAAKIERAIAAYFAQVALVFPEDA